MEVALPAAARALPPGPARRVALVCGLAATVAAVVVSVAVAATGADENPALVAFVRGLITAAPIATGLYVWYRRVNERFGLLLIVAGAGWFVTTLAESRDELVYTLARVMGWAMQVLFVYLVLAFPTGRLRRRTDRALAASMAAVVLMLFAPRLALAQTIDVPSPFTSCVEACPANPFFALDAEPAILTSVLQPLGALAGLAVTAATVVRLSHRRAAASSHSRRTLDPVLGVSAVFVGLVGIGLVAREADPHSNLVRTIAWLLALAMPAISFAFLLGLLRWRLFARRALERLAACLETMPDASTLRRVFAEALEDPSIRMAFPSRTADARWRDGDGRPTTAPGDTATEVRHDGRLVAVMTHDPALSSDPALLAAATAMAGLVLHNQRLAAEADAALREMRGSRARLAASADRERRRIERDLHDGAQQRLVALRIEMGLTEELARRDPDRAVGRLQALGHQVDLALEEIRALAHGVYPPILADRGIAEALRAAAAPMRARVEIESQNLARYAAEIESAVYFCVVEALQNVLKHAGYARRVVVVIQGGSEELRFSVRDDGAGAPDGVIRAGAGVTNMRQRLTAVGGDVEVTTTPHVGTTVRGHVPARAVDDH